MGNFDERQWGISVSAVIGADQVLVVAGGDLHRGMRIMGAQWAVQLAFWLSVSNSLPVNTIRRIPNKGSPLRPRCPQVSCWTRCRPQGELVGGQMHDVKWVHHRPGRRSGIGGGGAVAGEPVHSYHLDPGRRAR